MMGHKICFYGEIALLIPKLSLLPLLIWSTDLFMKSSKFDAADTKYSKLPQRVTGHCIS